MTEEWSKPTKEILMITESLIKMTLSFLQIFLDIFFYSLYERL